MKCIDEEIPFEIPQGWEWCRLSALTTRFSTGPFGTMLHKEDYTDNGVAVINPTNIINHKISLNNIKRISFAKAKELQGYAVNKGDIILARRGDLRKSAIITDFEDSCIAGTGSFIFHLLGIVNSFFILFYISPYVQDYLITDSIGTTMNNLNQKLLSRLLIPIPPRAEQVRIVSVVDELFSLVNTYDMMKNKLDFLNSSLHENIKKSILQEAIQGKLVPQIAEEGTAQELLKQIKEEKNQLVKEGKLKKSALNDSVIFRGDDNKYYTSKNKDTICIDDEIPFEIPDSWVWVRFGTIMINRDRERIPLSVTQRQFLSNRYDYYGASGVIDKVDRYLFDKELLLIGEDGANLLNRSTPIAFIAKGKYWVNNHAHVLDVYDGVMLKYIALYINSISLVPYVTGTAQPKMNQEKMNSILIALPPQKEQQRIVAQIEKLFEQLH